MCYGSVMHSLVLTGDDWRALENTNFLFERNISYGRWMRSLITSVSSQNIFAPSFTTPLLLIVITRFSVYTAGILSISNINKFLFCAIFVSCPMWIEPFYYSIQHLTMAIAMILSMCSIHFFLKSNNNILFLIPSILLEVLTISCYQTFGFFLPMIIILLSINKILSGDLNSLKQTLVRLTILLLSSGIIYLAIHYVLNNFIFDFHKPKGQYAVSVSLLNVDCFKNTINTIFAFFTRGDIAVINLSVLLIFFSLVIKYFEIVKNIKENHKSNYLISILLVSVLLCGFFIMPWSLGFVKAKLTFRYNSLAPLCLVFAYALSTYDNARFVKYRNAIVFFILLQFMYLNSSACFNKIMNNDRDINLAMNIGNQIISNPNFNKKSTYNLILNGKIITPFKLRKRHAVIDSRINSSLWEFIRPSLFQGLFIKTGFPIYINKVKISRTNRKSKKTPNEIIKIEQDNIFINLNKYNSNKS